MAIMLKRKKGNMAILNGIFGFICGYIFFSFLKDNAWFGNLALSENFSYKMKNKWMHDICLKIVISSYP